MTKSTFQLGENMGHATVADIEKELVGEGRS